MLRLPGSEGHLATAVWVLFPVLLIGTAGDAVAEAGLTKIYGYRARDVATLREGFADPPRAAGPWVYWFWFNNVVSRAEITREWEELADAGFAGVEKGRPSTETKHTPREGRGHASLAPDPSRFPVGLRTAGRC